MSKIFPYRLLESSNYTFLGKISWTGKIILGLGAPGVIDFGFAKLPDDNDDTGFGFAKLSSDYSSLLNFGFAKLSCDYGFHCYYRFGSLLNFGLAKLSPEPIFLDES